MKDGGGLYLLVNQQGESWRGDYRFEGNRKMMAIGVYPDVSLAMVRERHSNARALLAASTDPMQSRR